MFEFGGGKEETLGRATEGRYKLRWNRRSPVARRKREEWKRERREGGRQTAQAAGIDARVTSAS